MSTNALTPPSPPQNTKHSGTHPKWKIWLGGLALLFPWVLLLFQLSITWETNEQYAHGYLVPLLCLFLLLKIYPQEQEIESPEHHSALQGKLWLILGIPLLLAFIPVWLIRGANSDWRLINFVLYGIVFLLTLVHWYDDGGWRRIKHLLFPLLFFLVAIPWPLKRDLELTQWLQERVSSIIVDILLLMEHEARLEGTVIDVGVFGKIGVDQACSGINGLQASLVVTLFLGAYYRFGWINRIVLCLAGTLVALAFNLGRAFALSFLKVKGKGSYLDDPLFTLAEWTAPSVHDLAGWIENGLIFLAILLLARMTKGGLFLSTLANEPNRWLNLRSSPSPIFSILSILLVSGGAFWAEAHYRGTEKDLASLPVLRIDLKDPTILTNEQDISRQVAAQLHYEEATSTQWQDRFRNVINNFGLFVINPNAEYWQAFEARWDSGGACTAVLSTHSPESCLPLTGLTQINPTPGQDPILIPIKVDGQEVLFEVNEFSRNYRKLFVFRCFWPHKLAEGQPNLFPRGGYSFDGRIQSALEGRRNVGGTMLALA
ncbi:MAG: exosortase/archaeosortase family protein, partial [Opitutae bacterium]